MSSVLTSRDQSLVPILTVDDWKRQASLDENQNYFRNHARAAFGAGFDSLLSDRYVPVSDRYGYRWVLSEGKWDLVAWWPVSLANDDGLARIAVHGLAGSLLYRVGGREAREPGGSITMSIEALGPFLSLTIPQE